MRKRVNVVAAVAIITMTKRMNITMRKNAAVVAAVNITIITTMTMAAAPNTIIITSTPNTTTVRHRNPPVWST